MWWEDCFKGDWVQDEGFMLLESRVVAVDTVEEVGVYAPMTAEGNLLVNDILVSCLSTVDQPLLQRIFFKVPPIFPPSAATYCLHCSEPEPDARTAVAPELQTRRGSPPIGPRGATHRTWQSTGCTR